MATAYIIIMGWGAYSGRGTKPVRVYLDRKKAEATMAALEDIAKRNSIWNPTYHSEDYKLAEKIGPACKAEYAAIGFDASVWDDWELAEAEFDSTPLA